MGKKESSKHILSKARKAVEKSGLSYQQIGERMGYPAESARQSVSQFLHSRNPTIAMLRRLAEALEVEPGELL